MAGVHEQVGRGGGQRSAQLRPLLLDDLWLRAHRAERITGRLGQSGSVDVARSRPVVSAVAHAAATAERAAAAAEEALAKPRLARVRAVGSATFYAPVEP